MYYVVLFNPHEATSTTTDGRAQYDDSGSYIYNEKRDPTPADDDMIYRALDDELWYIYDLVQAVQLA